jgi:hypothetical protein
MGHTVLLMVLIVRLYDAGGLAPSERQAAVATASAILGAAHVPTSWPPCAIACNDPLQPGEIAIRLARSGAAIGDEGMFELGYSAIDPATGGGVLATVYLDRAEWTAARAGLGVGVLVGRAMAHEIGHLLLGSAGHDPRGVMRAIWSPEALRSSPASDWRFTPRQTAALHRALRVRIPLPRTAALTSNNPATP